MASILWLVGSEQLPAASGRHENSAIAHPECQTWGVLDACSVASCTYTVTMRSMATDKGF